MFILWEKMVILETKKSFLFELTENVNKYYKVFKING